MRKSLLLIITVLLCSIISCAQTESFDIATYKVPKGWTKSTKPGIVTYSASNEAKHNYCMISIYASKPSTGTTEEEFAKEWKKLVVTPFSVSEEPELNKLSDEGRDAIAGTATFTMGKVKSAVMLTTVVGFGRTISILTLSNDDSYQADVESFFDGITFDNTVPEVTTQTTAYESQAASTSGSTFHNTNALEGVWMTLHLKSQYYDVNSSGDPQWITFFDNGRVYDRIPDDMNNFDKNSSSLGTYQFSNGNGTLKWFPQSPPTEIITQSTDDILIRLGSGDDNYHRCKSVDGVRLQGSWTSYANPNDPFLDDHSVAKPMITFNSNGSFTDYGIFTLLDVAVFPKPNTQPGSGTYSINNFMLTLNYDNGVTRQVSFTGLLSSDVSTTNNSIYLHRVKFKKRAN